MPRTGTWRGFKVYYRRREHQWAGVHDSLITLTAPTYARLRELIDTYWRYVPSGQH